MKRSTTTFSIISTAACVSTLVWASVYGDVAKADPSEASSTTVDGRSSPPDLTPYNRPSSLEDFSPGGELPMGTDTQGTDPGKQAFMVDVVVNNTIRI